MSNKKIYFSCSVRGGREYLPYYEDIVLTLKTSHDVLTEHLIIKDIVAAERHQSDEEIYLQDIAFMDQADVLIAEVSVPSLGVGYELAYFEKLNRPMYLLYNSSSNHKLSAMLSGNSNFVIYTYESHEELDEILDEIMSELEER
ncbi:MAG: nucleoside 2-deoxyribosyltransferase [Bacilli bacterium]|jgi:nucleoside 2-deoxyribosyltransferase|nr:nucleoside 2-deoxyribosyltransferase [Bacilli bacterium]